MSASHMLTGFVKGVPGSRLLQGWRRGLSFSPALRCEAAEEEEEENLKKKLQVDPSKDRSKVIPVETSIRYLQSEAYQTTYGNDPVWKKYRRNFKGPFPPRLTRRKCIRNKVISTGNPCPICRDEYLVLDPINEGLLKQFICPHTNAILPTKITNLCRMQNQNLLVAVEKARDAGILTFDVPFRHYHYPEYYPPLKAEATETVPREDGLDTVAAPASTSTDTLISSTSSISDKATPASPGTTAPPSS